MSVCVLTTVAKVSKFSLVHWSHYEFLPVSVSVCVLTMVTEVLKFSFVHHSYYKLMSICMLTTVSEVFKRVEKVSTPIFYVYSHPVTTGFVTGIRIAHQQDKHIRAYCRH